MVFAKYMEWRQFIRSNVATYFNQLTRLDFNIFFEVWSCLAVFRDDSSQNLAQIDEMTASVFKLAVTAADFPNRIELVLKNVVKVFSRFVQNPSDLLALFDALELLSGTISSVIVKNASLPKSSSYFRCLGLYAQAAMRAGKFSVGEKSLQIYSANFKLICESQLRGPLQDLEKVSLHLTLAMCRWLVLANKPTESVSKQIANSLLEASSILSSLLTAKAGLHLLDKGVPTDEYLAVAKVLTQLKEWPDLIMRLKPGASSPPPEVKGALKDLLKAYASFYELCAQEESKTPNNPQNFKNWQLVSITLGTVGVLCVDLGQMDHAMAYFEKAEANIRQHATWAGLKQLYQQLHLAVGYVNSVPAYAPHGISWMKQSCKLHQEYIDKFPKEPSAELASKLGFLASLESRSLKSVPTAKSTSSSESSQVQKRDQSATTSTQGHATTIETAFQTAWLPNTIYPLISLHIKKQHHQASQTTQEDSFQLFFPFYAATMSPERLKDYLKLIEFENNLWVAFSKFKVQQRLIASVQATKLFDNSLGMAKLSLMNVIGARKRLANISATESSDAFAKELKTIHNDINNVIVHLEDYNDENTEQTEVEKSHVAVDMGLAYLLRSVLLLEHPASMPQKSGPESAFGSKQSKSTQIENSVESIQSAVDASLSAFSTVLGRMLAIRSEKDGPVSKPLLDQNRSHWPSLDLPLEYLQLLSDMLHFFGDQKRFVAVTKLLLKFEATLGPLGFERVEHVRMLWYAQIGATFHELGYDDPLATRYYTKSGGGSESSIVAFLLGLEGDVSQNGEIGDWLASSLSFLHDLGRIPEFDYIGHLETVSQTLEVEMEDSSPSRFKFLQSVRASIQFALAHMKATTGRTDEAIIDALVAFKLRAPSAPSKPDRDSNQTKSEERSNTAAPPYWRPTSWKFIKAFMDSMDQLGQLYYLQGSVSESRYYYRMALQLAKRYTNQNAEFHFSIRLAQLDLESGYNTSTTPSFNDLGDDVPEAVEQIVLPQTPSSVCLASASAHITKGNASLRAGSHDLAREQFGKAEELLLELIDFSFVECLDPTESGATSSAKPKTTARGRTAKKSAAAATGDSSAVYRFSMSPAKLPKAKIGCLPNDYIGIKRIQLGISLQMAVVDYLQAANSTESEDLLERASTALASIKEQLEELSLCPSVQLDLAVVMFHQAKVMIAQSEHETGVSSAWTSGAPQKAEKPTTAKKTASKAKKVIDKVTLARETLNSAFALSIASGSIPKISSDICQYLVEISGLMDMWSTIAKQNSAIGITMRHQLLSNIYRLGISRREVSEGGEEVEEDVEALAEAVRSKLSLEDSEGQYQSYLQQILEEMEFDNDKIGSEDFKSRYVDVLGSSEMTKPFVVCTLSMGPDNRSIILSRLKYGEDPLICRIDVSQSLDELIEKSFSIGASIDSESDSNEEDEKPVLMRSATALLEPLLGSNQPILKRSASTSLQSRLQSSGLSSSLDTTTLEKPKSTRSAKGTAAKKSGLSASSASLSTAKKSTASKPAKRSAIRTIEDIGDKELSDMLSNLNVSDTSSLSSSSASETSQISEPVTEKATSFKRFVSELHSIINDSNSIAVTSSSKNAEGSSSSKDFNHQWWTKRYALDDRMNGWLSNFEDTLLSSYKTLLAGELVDSELSSALEEQLEDLKIQVEKSLKIPVGTLSLPYFRALVLGADLTSSKNIMDSLLCLTGWSDKALTPAMSQSLNLAAMLIQDTWANLTSSESNLQYQDEQKQAMSVSQQQWLAQTDEVPEMEEGSLVVKEVVKRQRRQPVILILDKHLHALPWESLPALRLNPVSRMPSLYALRAAIVTQLQSSSMSNVIRDGLDVDKVFYMINPSKDLQSSQETLHPFIVSNPSWQGLIGEKPQPADYMKALEQANILLYAGHNSGAQYLNGEMAELRKVRSRAGGCAVWMMGCESAKMTDHADFDPSGMVVTYMLSGCPSVVGNLWAVTTKDLDKATVSMLNWLKSDHETVEASKAPSSDSQLSSTTILDAILKARQSCKLQFINAAALISYGLPLRVNRGSSSKKVASIAKSSKVSSRASEGKSTATRKGRVK